MIHIIILKNIRYVSRVVKQKTLDYSYNLKKYKPDYVVHGDDWKSGIQKDTRAKVIKTIKDWSGKLVEISYTKNISSTQIKKKILETGTTPELRKSKLNRLMQAKDIVRILETHNAIGGLIIENININQTRNWF